MFAWCCFSGGDQTQLLSVPGPNNHEYLPQRIGSHRDEALIVGMFILNGNGKLVVENRDRIREVDAVLLAIRPASRWPTRTSLIQYMHECAYSQHWRPGLLSKKFELVQKSP